MGVKSRKARSGAIPKQESANDTTDSATTISEENLNIILQTDCISHDDLSSNSRRKARRMRHQCSPSPSPSPSPTPSHLALREHADLVDPDPAMKSGLAKGAASLVVPKDRPHPLLIISIGNPGTEYATTYHNAGHIVARNLAPHKHNFPHDWKYASSKAFMNLSGPEVAKFFRRHTATASRLVVLHDDLEREVGSVRVLGGYSSAQGHNGIKSIQQSLPSGKHMDWWRIAIGVGRPARRDPMSVANYVLSNMRADELAKLEQCTDRVVEELEKLATG